jgi:PAS domain S-box-containing protein
MDVDVARALSVRLGRDIRVDVMDWDAAQQKVLRGEADGLLSMSMSPERQAVFDFTDPTITHDFGIFVRRGNLTIHGRDELEGGRIGVTPGGFPRRVLEGQASHHLVLIRNYEDGFARLAAGTIDAVAADRWVGAYTIERGGLQNIVATGPPFATLPGGIAIRKGQGALVHELDAAVRVMKADGTLAQIQERWRPKEMLFVSRQRVNRVVYLSAGVFVTAVCAALALFGMAVATHARAREAVERALVTSQQRLRHSLSAAEIDIIERKQVEGQVRLLAHALRSANDCVCITDTSDHILYVNDAFLRTYEFEEQDLLGRHISIIRSENDPDVVSGMTDGTAGQGWRGTLWNRSRTGRIFPVSLATSAVHDDQGEIVALVGVARDMTREVAAEEGLRQAQKMEAIGRLAGGIAHDFNNLLTVIVGYSELVSAALEPGSPIQDDVGEIQRAAGSAVSLTRQLLIFSRKDVVKTEVLDLNEVVDRIERMLRRIVGEDITFVVRLARDLGSIHADAGQIEQVVMNLVVNARDAMPEGGTVTVETAAVDLDDAFVSAHPGARIGPFARLIVADTGHGMTPEVQSQIFTPFFTTKGPSTGTGLGLATVHGIVQQSSGWIGVESAIGKGTRFSIYFPRLATAAARDSMRVASAAAAPVSATILFVEDDESIRALGARTLRQQGFTVLAARHAVEALQLAADQGRRIDLLLTDIVMPGLSGRDLAARLRQSRADLKVLYTSGYSDDAGALRDIQMHGPGFMQKPYSPESLARQVRALLGGV